MSEPLMWTWQIFVQIDAVGTNMNINFYIFFVNNNKNNYVTIVNMSIITIKFTGTRVWWSAITTQDLRHHFKKSWLSWEQFCLNSHKNQLTLFYKSIVLILIATIIPSFLYTLNFTLLPHHHNHTSTTESANPKLVVDHIPCCCYLVIKSTQRSMLTIILFVHRQNRCTQPLDKSQQMKTMSEPNS